MFLDTLLGLEGIYSSVNCTLLTFIEFPSENIYVLLVSAWRRQWHPTPVLLPGKSHGQRGLVGCSPWVAKSWTQLNNFTFIFHFHALEKEVATYSSVLAWRISGRAWWAAVYGVSQSRTRLTRLSSSSSSSSSFCLDTHYTYTS